MEIYIFLHGEDCLDVAIQYKQYIDDYHPARGGAKFYDQFVHITPMSLETSEGSKNANLHSNSSEASVTCHTTKVQ